MLKKLVGVCVVLAFSVGLLAAEEIRGVITKVDGNKVTVQKFKKGEKGSFKAPEKDGDPVTLTAADKVKVVKSKFNTETMKLEAGEEIAGGLSAEIFKTIGEKGLRATVVTDDSNKITEIRVSTFERKKKSN